MDDMIKRGCQRIGYVIDDTFTTRISMACLTGYLVKQRELKPKNRLPSLESGE